jgi:acetyl-CoA acetyltransferase
MRSLGELNWICSIAHGNIASCVVEAVHALSARACRYALIWRGMAVPEGKYGVVHSARARGDDQFIAPFGMHHYGLQFALLCQRYMYEYGLERADLAPFIVANRLRASRNQEAVFFGKPIEREDYLNSKMLAEPLAYLDCDMPVSGCGALVLARYSEARDLCESPVPIHSGVAGGLDRGHSRLQSLAGFETNASAVARALWRKSGMTAADIDHAHVHDGFSFFTPLWLEAFGFCEPGGGPAYLAGTSSGFVGARPVNTSGGVAGDGPASWDSAAHRSRSPDSRAMRRASA